MSEPSGEFSVSAVRAKRAQCAPPPVRDEYSFPPEKPGAGPTYTTTKVPKLAFDPWRLLSALKQNLRPIAASALGLGLLGFGFGFLKTDQTVRITLLAREANNALTTNGDSDVYRPRQFSSETLVALMQSPELSHRVVAASKPPVDENTLTSRIRVEKVNSTDLVALNVSGRSTTALVDTANLFATEAVEMGRQVQISEASQMNRFCTEQLTALDQQLAQANRDLVNFQTAEKLADPDAEKLGYIKQVSDVLARADNARIEIQLVELQIEALQHELSQQNSVAQKLEAARNKLTEMFGRYTEAHPTVQGQRKLIAELEKQLATAGQESLATARYSENPQVAALYARLVDLQTRKVTLQRETAELTKLRENLQRKVTGLSEKGLQYATIKAQLDGLQKTRAQLAMRQRDAQLYQQNSQGYYRVFAPATARDVDSVSRWLAGMLYGIVGLGVGALGCGLVVASKELADRRLKTADDVRRETGLPVLASLGDLSRMSPTEREAWAFRSWTAIAGQLNASPNRGLVCGIISSATGEGRSTWIDLLVGAAKQRGLQVVKISTMPGADGGVANEMPANVVPQDFGAKRSAPAPGKSLATTDRSELAFAPGLSASRTAVAAHAPGAGKVWDLAQRKEWQNSLAQLRRIDNLVLLVELPPAALPEAILLAESLPQLIWLTDSGRASVRDTREQLQTLRHAKCRLVGAVLNHEPKSIF